MTYASLKPGCTFHVFHNGGPDTEYMVRLAEGRQFRISADAYRLLHDMDAGVPLEEIHGRMFSSPASVSCEEFKRFVFEQYSDFLKPAFGHVAAPASQQKASLRLLVARTLVSERAVTAAARFLSWLYGLAPATVAVVLVVAAHVALYTRYVPVFGAEMHPPIALLACLFSVMVHELGHAAAVSRFGAKPGSIGIGLYILLPVFYADVSQVWGFRRGQRVVVDLGGVYFQQIVFAALAIAAVMGHNPSLRAACIAIDTMTFIALNPVFHFDGYWVLVDGLGTPNLQRMAVSYLNSLMVWVRQFWKARFPRLPLPGARGAVIAVYAIAGHILLLAVILLNLRWIRVTTANVVQTLPLLASNALRAAQGHRWLYALDYLTEVVFVGASGLTLLAGLLIRGRQLTQVFSTRKLPKQSLPTHA